MVVIRFVLLFLFVSPLTSFSCTELVHIYKANFASVCFSAHSFCRLQDFSCTMSGNPLNNEIRNLDKIVSNPILSILARGLRKPSGGLSVGAEFARPDRLMPHDVSYISKVLRDAKASMIVINVDADDGYVDVAAFVSEQSRARGAFPGPCPIFVRRTNSTILADIQETAKAGAAGLFIPATNKLHEYTDHARALNLEPIIEVQDVPQARMAINNNCSILYAAGHSPESLIDHIAELRAAIPPEVRLVAAIDAMQRECREVDQAADLRAAGCDAIFLARAVTNAAAAAAASARGDDPGGYLRWALAELQTKRSASFSFAVGAISSGGGGGGGDGQDDAPGKASRRFKERWTAAAAERDPQAWKRWSEYKKTRDYQYRAQIWGA